jgi:hypothetical protein
VAGEDPEGDQGPEDDLTILNETLLYRWVAPAHIKRAEGVIECRDGAFKNFPHPETLRMSVVLGDTLAARARTPESILDGRPGYGLVAVTAGEVRAEEQRALRSELPEEPAHGDVWGVKTAARRRRLAQVARWVMEP